MKTPVLSTRPGPEGSAGDKGRKRESEVLSRTQSIEREEQVRQGLFEELVLAALRLEALQVAQSISQCPSLSTLTPQKEKSLSHHTIQQLIIEKDQALADLNSVEKSLADLFRRYEKMKDVLEGFRKVTLFFNDVLQNKEIEELTKICDELIAKMGKS
ncbi:hypothetical protein GOODEAATRI_007151 [Goodea atripinnis]|uniref:Transforming acidic coiled-coil-containing protein C-terminal domain-containing protein n=1 Tax=Goodea atripinnis TaxID=208336 RepID=A0ABV0PVZ8_9TELE